MLVECDQIKNTSPDTGDIDRAIQRMPLLRSFILYIAFLATNISLLIGVAEQDRLNAGSTLRRIT